MGKLSQSVDGKLNKTSIVWNSFQGKTNAVQLKAHSSVFCSVALMYVHLYDFPYLNQRFSMT